ncbi:MAG: ABC transporter ATP-binding protein [Nitrospirae bacterium]|nr:ABC transporter ATP-binding protein [Nitrospirota bacterium]
MIEIIGLEKSFGGQKVLQGVDLKIADREVIAIIGESGGGKTVLLRHLIGLMKPDKGSIMVDGADISTMSKRELDKIRDKFGIVFQGSALFDSMTVFENVVFPLREKTDLDETEILQRGKSALEDVGLRGIDDKYPSEISGGMKRRVALARALILGPSTIFFDEPTTGLDPIIMNAIHKLIISTHEKYGFTGIIISHEIPEVFEVADRVAMLYSGRIIASGTPHDIICNKDPFVKKFVSTCRDADVSCG